MTEEIMIDVSNCPHKSDEDCMEVPICNEYGDLMGYQSCEAQTLCPYRSQKKIARLEQENKELRAKIESFMNGDYCADGCKKMNNAFCDAHTAIINENNNYRSALEKIRDLCTHYENTNDKCVTNCYAHFIVTDLIQNKIKEVLE